ncbi:ROK family protein [Thalassotalea atypica]|uniref:ROK family protein n=1 Tax=Thalassotalea atypica TaxID=2054316 RepID=UPI0025737A8F|nr:ROK family protein [Thalassotalea atypica]
MIIAIDVGGTKISAALMDNGQIIEQRKVESIIHSDLVNLPEHLVKLCQGWIEKSEYAAIACTGQVGSEHVNFLSAKKKLPLKSQLEAGFNMPVFLLNDAASAAWAEYCFIKNNKTNSMTEYTDKAGETLVYITVSTGIGGGIIQNGQLVTSGDGFCAHLGHTSVQHIAQHSIPCHCGRVNCAEAIASGTAIAKQASVLINKTVNCKEVFQQYADLPEIAELINQCTSAITDLIANIKATTGTNNIILGGSVGSAPLFFEQVTKKVAQLPEIYQLTVRAPQCGADADLIGAYYYAKHINNHSIQRK